MLPGKIKKVFISYNNRQPTPYSALVFYLAKTKNGSLVHLIKMNPVRQLKHLPSKEINKMWRKKLVCFNSSLQVG